MKINNKVKLDFWQIWNMNIGFFGIQFSFGLQQTAISPIFSFLGAHHDQLPLLNLAGPVTGLVIQPIIGAISDKTWSPRWGRRKPFFLIGAIVASLCLFVFPYSSHLWFAVGLLWILDAANNTAMEPYRAFIGDKLPDEQLPFGFQMQSLFVGAGITVANLSLFLFQDWFGGSESGLCDASSTSIPKWVYYSFFLGAISSLVTIIWSVVKTPEIPPSDEEIEKLKREKESKSFFERALEPFREIFSAIGDMPKLMWRLSLVYFFQWYALFVYWQFIAPMIREKEFGITDEMYSKFDGIVEKCQSGIEISATDMSFAENVQNMMGQALGQVGLMNGTYNFVTMIVALALVPFALKYGSKLVYVVSLFVSAIAMISLPFLDGKIALLIPMILLGIGWACMMGIPYAMVSKVIPEDRRGVYMGIVNMMIVIPMLIETITFGPVVKNLLNNSAVNAILFAGVFFALAAIAALRLNKAEVVD